MRMKGRLFVVGENDISQKYAVGVEEMYVGALVAITVETRLHIPAVEIVVVFGIVKFCYTSYHVFVNTGLA